MLVFISAAQSFHYLEKGLGWNFGHCLVFYLVVYLWFLLVSFGWIVASFSEVFVLVLFLNVWSMRPFTICSDLGRYLLTMFTVRPGNFAKKFCFISSIHVEIGGLKHAWWRKIARFVSVSIRVLNFLKIVQELEIFFLFLSFI